MHIKGKTENDDNRNAQSIMIVLDINPSGIFDICHFVTFDMWLTPLDMFCLRQNEIQKEEIFYGTIV